MAQDMAPRVQVAMFSERGSGHMNPMLELARRLAALNFTVSFLIAEGDLMNLDLEFQADDHISFVPLPNPKDSHWVFSPEKEQSVERVLGSLSVRCIISDMFFGWTQDIANRLGIPRVAFAACSATSDAISHHITLLHSRGYIPLRTEHLENESEMISFIPGIEPLHPRHLPMFLRTDNPPDNPWVLKLGKEFQRVKEALCVLVNTVEELEQRVVDEQRLVITNYFPVGPLIPASSEASSSEKSLLCLNWLNKQAPNSVLYVAFGSVTTLSGGTVEAIAGALKASSRPFLWAIRKDFAKDQTSGEFFEGLIKRFGEQGLIVDWAPQLQVLQHPSVGGFFTHCGWNSTLETLRSGVPTLCWPCSAEQNLNAFIMVEKWKIGLHAGEGEIDRSCHEGSIVNLIETLMESDLGSEMKTRAQELQKVVRGAHEGGSSSEMNLQSFKNIVAAR